MSYNAPGGWGAPLTSGSDYNQPQQQVHGEDDGGWGGPPEEVEWAPPGAWPSDPVPKPAPAPVAEISQPTPVPEPTPAAVQAESVKTDASETQEIGRAHV